MTADPKLVEMVAEWRRLDAEAGDFDKADKGDESDSAQKLAMDVLHAIADLPATSNEDIVLKLALAHEAYVGKAEDREHFLHTPDPIADFVWQSLADARRMAGGAP